MNDSSFLERERKETLTPGVKMLQNWLLTQHSIMLFVNGVIGLCEVMKLNMPTLVLPLEHCQLQKNLLHVQHR